MFLLPRKSPISYGRGYVTQASAFFARLATQPTGTRKALYNTLIKSLVEGGVFAKLDTLHIFAAVDAATALTNLVSASYGATAVNSPTFTADQGYTIANTKYLNSNFNPSTAGGNWTQNSASAFLWSLTDVAASTKPILGTAGGSGNRVYIYPRYTGDVYLSALNDDSSSSDAVVASNNAYGLSRTGSTAFNVFINGALDLSPAASSNAPVNADILIGNDGGVMWDGKVSVTAFGGGLTDAESLRLYNACLAYLQGVGAV